LELKVGDILLEYDGREFGSVAQFIRYRNEETGDAMRTLRVWRDGETIAFELAPGKMGASLDGVAISPELLAAAREKMNGEAQNAGENADAEVDEEMETENEK
jgi:hypothetical protein